MWSECSDTHLIDLRDRQILADWSTSTSDTAKTWWANGLLKSIDNGVSKSDYAYNTRNLLTSETQTLAGQPARVVSYDYDADGLRTDLVYPSSRAVEYAWTSHAQLQSVSADGPPPLATYTYDKAGRNTTLVHENGITESKSYDAASQLLANTHLKGGTPVSGHGYTLDATGRRTNETFADGSTPARSYGYDTADQVTAASYGNSQSDSYAYDAMGNRTSASFLRSVGVPPTNGTVTYNANNANQYTSITGLTPISHDANGNLTQQNGVSYAWDSENRLLSVTPNTPAIGDKSLVHTYDGQHRRVTRTIREWTASGWVNNETTHFIYDGWNVIEEYSINTSGSNLTKNFTWGQDLGGSASLQVAGGVGGLIMVEEVNGSTTTAYHFAYDGNGNVTEITDLSGNPAASYRYDAFGNALVSNGSYANTNRYRFSTKPLDGEVTDALLYYYGHRYYDPIAGRWPSRDPIGERGGVNLYGFVGNNPLSGVDLMGLSKYYRLKKQRATPASDYWVVNTRSGTRWVGNDLSFMSGAYSIIPTDSGGYLNLVNTYFHDSSAFSNFSKHQVGLSFFVEFGCDSDGNLEYLDGEGPKSDPSFKDGIAYAHSSITMSGIGTPKVQITAEIKTGASANVTIGGNVEIGGSIGGHDGAAGGTIKVGTSISWTGAVGVEKGTTKVWFVECECHDTDDQDTSGHDPFHP